MTTKDVGARFVLFGKAQMLAGIREARAEVKALSKTIVDSAAAAKAASEGFFPANLEGIAAARLAYQGKVAATTERQLTSVAKVGKVAFYGLAAAGVAAGYEGLKVHSQFQAAMTQVSTLAGVQQSRLAGLTAGIKALAPQVGQGLVPMADALYRVASTPAGLKATNDQLLQMARYAGMLATIGGPNTDLEQTARIIGGATSTGVKGTGSPKNIVSLAAATVGSGDIRMSDFVDFLGTGVLTSGKLTGIPLNQMAAFLALAGSNLQSGAVSGHGLAHGLQLMAAPTVTASNAMRAVGLAPTTLGNLMQSGNLPKAISTLEGALSNPLGPNADLAQLAKFGISAQDIARATQVGFGGMGDAGKTDMNLVLTRMFGGAKMGIPVDMLVTESKNYDAILKHINTSQGNFGKAWAQQTDTLSYKTQAFTTHLSDLADTIGSDLTPMAKGFLTVGGDVLGWFSKSGLRAGALAGTISLILGPAIGLYLVRKFKDASGAISDVVQGYGKIVNAIFRKLLPGLYTQTSAAEGATMANRGLATSADGAAAAETLEGRSALMAGGEIGASRLGLGAGIAGKLGMAAGLAGAGVIAGSLARGSAGDALKPGRSVGANLRSVGGDVLEGAGVGAAVGSVVPVLGTALGAGIGAIGGLAYGERHQLASLAHHAWDDIFGGGDHSAKAVASGITPIQLDQRIYLDGKQITASVKTTVRAQGARQ